MADESVPPSGDVFSSSPPPPAPENPDVAAGSVPESSVLPADEPSVPAEQMPAAPDVSQNGDLPVEDQAPGAAPEDGGVAEMPQQDMGEPPVGPPPFTRSAKMPMLVGGLIFVLLLAGGGYYYLAVRGKKTPTVVPTPTKAAARTPTPTALPPTLTPVASEAAVWRAYNNEQYGFSIQYPSTLTASEDARASAFIVSFSKQISLFIRTVSPFDCRGDCPNLPAGRDVTINGVTAKVAEGTKGNVGGTDPGPFLVTVFQKDDKYYTLAYSFVANQPDEKEIYETMAHSFVFLQKQQPTGTPAPLPEILKTLLSSAPTIRWTLQHHVQDSVGYNTVVTGIKAVVSLPVTEDHTGKYPELKVMESILKNDGWKTVDQGVSGGTYISSWTKTAGGTKHYVILRQESDYAPGNLIEVSVFVDAE